MVFNRLVAGFGFGILFPMFCDRNVYLLIATSFLRPHLKFRMEQSKRHKDIAIRTDQLDSYLKDVFKSGLFFFLAAPFVFYRVYYKGEDIYGQTGQEEPD